MVTNLSSSKVSLTRTSLLGVTCTFHWPVSHCFSEHACRPSHTTKPRCAHVCTSRKKSNTTYICLTAARGQMRVEFMRTRGSRALPACAGYCNQPVAQPGELVSGMLKARRTREPSAALPVGCGRRRTSAPAFGRARP